MFYIKTALIAALALQISAKVYDKCSLAEKFLDLTVPLADIPILACIANSRTLFDSSYHKGLGWGIFGINEDVWCNAEANLPCMMTCEEMIENITSAVSCALTVKRVGGYRSWILNGVGEYCQQKDTAYLNDCPNYMRIHGIVEKYSYKGCAAEELKAP